ncbi:patatin [Gandjariella thermophila]|uniref:Patatin n=1 Tax=Gandjariella thermophila TaxID=1931992 RepID=A0A4D4J1K6_9PSEU|nr:patatin [Gandjariella thermophila]
MLGGGGVAGIAWETGVLAGLADAGVDVSGADTILGTSAGATVAAQLTSGLPVGELLRRQVEPGLQAQEIVPTVSLDEVMDEVMRLYQDAADLGELRRRIGAFALAADTVPEETRRAVIASRLPAHTWPKRPIAVTAVDAHSGEPRVFDRDSGVDLVDAVAASCAVPGVWPPVTIDGSRYVDGGVRSMTNADLVAGYERVLVLAAMAGQADPALPEQLTLLEQTGRVEMIAPDDASTAAMGADPLDPEVRTPSAQAGYAQGKQVAATVAKLWDRAA